jgi:pyrroline-5-carboxylate reductase
MHGLTSVGFIGTGALTAAIVRGIRSRSDAPTIHLSPRSEPVSAALARELPNVVREASNADVVANSTIVILGVRPQQVAAALQGLPFRRDHAVVSFAATLRCSELSRLVAPATRVCRATPMATTASGRGPVVVWPALPEAVALFEGIADLVVAETEAQMAAFGCASGLVATFFEIEHSVCMWLVQAGIPPDAASLYVRSMFAAAAHSGLEHRSAPLAELAAAHQTPGGLNERARRLLLEAGWFDRIGGALQDLSSLRLGD